MVNAPAKWLLQLNPVAINTKVKNQSGAAHRTPDKQTKCDFEVRCAYVLKQNIYSVFSVAMFIRVDSRSFAVKNKKAPAGCRGLSLYLLQRLRASRFKCSSLFTACTSGGFVILTAVA